MLMPDELNTRAQMLDNIGLGANMLAKVGAPALEQNIDKMDELWCSND